MAITIDNSASRIAVRVLGQNQAALQTSLERLSTGFRINSAKDDPAGLIASEMLRSEMAQTSAAISNAQRSDQVMATADGGLSEISNLLVSLQGLVVASANTAGLSADEISANQLQVDSILSSIDRLSNATEFGGQKLLDGQLGYQISAGPGMQAIQGLNVHSANVAGGAAASETVAVLASAQHATLVYHGGVNGLANSVNLSLTGNTGTIQLNFVSAVKASAIAAAINQFSNSTGVTASANATDVAFMSAGYGATQYVSVESSNAAAWHMSNLAGITQNRAVGGDATVTINGQKVEANGLAITAVTDALNASFTLDSRYNVAGTIASFTVSGGATFALSPNVDSAGLTSIGLSPVRSGTLGFVQSGGVGYTLADLGTSGAASLKSGKGDISQEIVSGAIKDVSRLRGQIGAFRKYTIGSSINALNVTLENLSSAESNIRDTDFAAETAELTRRQILVAASQSVLNVANQNQQIILKLLQSVPGFGNR